MSDVLTLKCRVYRSRKFSVLDRLAILFRGVIYVSIGNGKAHTTVLLSTREPKE